MTKWYKGVLCLACLFFPQVVIGAAGERLQAHRVVAGDSWNSLAHQANMSSDWLQSRYNPEHGRKPLRVGELIWLPIPPAKPKVTSVVFAPAGGQAPSGAKSQQSSRPKSKPKPLPRGFKLDPDQTQAYAASQKLLNHYLDGGLAMLKTSSWRPLQYLRTDYQLPLFGAPPTLDVAGVLPDASWHGQGWLPQYSLDYRQEQLTAGVGGSWATPLWDKWYWRLNGMLDYQLDSGHRRAGLGVELTQPGMQLVVNGYVPVSDWARQGDGFAWERAAAGYDLRLEGELPFYPQLFVFGRYYEWQGHNLQLYGSGNAASANSIGLTYNLSDSIHFSWEQKGNSKGNRHNQVAMRLNVPLEGSLRQLFGFFYATPLQDLCQPFWRQSVMVIQRR